MSSPTAAKITVTPSETRAIAKDAYVYGYPMVDITASSMRISSIARIRNSRHRGTSSATFPASSRPRTRRCKLPTPTRRIRWPASICAPDIKQALEQGMADAWKEYQNFKSTQIDTGKTTSDDLFDTRDFSRTITSIG